MSNDRTVVQKVYQVYQVSIIVFSVGVRVSTNKVNQNRGRVCTRRYLVDRILRPFRKAIFWEDHFGRVHNPRVVFQIIYISARLLALFTDSFY